MSESTGTTTAATEDGYCRFVYGDTSNPSRVEVSAGGKWIALKGIATVTALNNLTSSPPVAARVEFSDMTLVAASRLSAMSTTAT